MIWPEETDGERYISLGVRGKGSQHIDEGLSTEGKRMKDIETIRLRIGKGAYDEEG